MPELVRRPGMTSWKVVNQQMSVFETHESYVEATKTTKTKGTVLTPSHFPPKDVEALHLERWCGGCWPCVQS